MAPPAFNPPPAFVEPTPRWVRVRAGDTWVADSRRAMLLAWYGPDRLPTYCLPADDVRTDLLTPAAAGGPAWATAYDVTVEGERFEAAAYLIAGAGPPLDAVAGMWTFPWDGPVAWFEEAQEVHVHARDPHKRVDVVPSERHVRVELAGHLLADSTRPSALFETTLPTRWYLPVDDVRWDLLEPSDTVTRCPYKGTARYWSVVAGADVVPDVAWSYPQPVPECPGIADLVCFFNEKVDLTIDGVPEVRPVTPFS